MNKTATDTWAQMQSVGVEGRVQRACLHCSYHNHSSYTNHMRGITVTFCIECGLPVCSHCLGEDTHCSIAAGEALPNGPAETFLCNEGLTRLTAL